MFNFLSLLFRYRDAKSLDELGLYPKAVHTKAMPERRYLWTSRVLVIASAINISITAILTLVIYLLLPNRGATPILLTDKQNMLTPLMRQEINATPIDLLTESFIRDYITIRHKLPQSYIELGRIWQQGSQFQAYSTNEVWSEFYRSVDYKKIRKYLRKGYWRNIEIENISRLFNNLYSVRFKTTTGIKGKSQTIEALWNAYIQITYQKYDAAQPPSWYMVNPYGFKITDYYLSYLGKPSH